MTPRVESSSWLPHYSWWVMATCVIATGLVGNWFIAGGVLAVFLAHAFRPFDFVTAYLLVIAGATFVHYEGGNMTLQLALLSGANLLMLVCYVLAGPGGKLVMPRTSLTPILVVYLLLSTVNFGRGLISGYPIKHVLIEVYAALGLGTAFLLANQFDRRHLRLAFGVFTIVALGNAALGFHRFSVVRTHSAGIYFHVVPGMVALFLFNLGLRSKQFSTACIWMSLSLLLFLHQFLSFRRGLWLGCLAGIVASALIFAAGQRSRARWLRTGLAVGALVGAGVVGTFSMAAIYGQVDILSEAGGRFVSIGSTELTAETRSNVTRLVEYAGVIGFISQSPLIGYGLGYTFLVPNPLNDQLDPQWYVHQNYLLVWLKQGVLGLGVFLWMLWAAVRFSAGHARRREDPLESSWFAATAAGTLYLAAFSLSDFPFDMINATYPLALLWGGSMAMAREGFVNFRWSPDSSSASSKRAQEDVS